MKTDNQGQQITDNVGTGKREGYGMGECKDASVFGKPKHWSDAGGGGARSYPVFDEVEF